MPIYDSRLPDIIFPLGLALSFLCLMAQVSIDLPWHELNIPITGQSLAVLLIGYALGGWLGPVAIILYLLLGIGGAPVFANGASGIAVLTKGSGGFLYGFVFAAAAMGWFGKRQWGRNLGKGMVAMAAGTIVILFFGILHLYFLYDFAKALDYGFFPFWRGALVKIILGALLLLVWHCLSDHWKRSIEQVN